MLDGAQSLQKSVDMFFNFLPFVGSTSDSLEHMTRHAQRKLMLSDKHFPGLFIPKQRCLYVAMGPHDCFHVRFESRARSRSFFAPQMYPGLRSPTSAPERYAPE